MEDGDFLLLVGEKRCLLGKCHYSRKARCRVTVGPRFDGNAGEPGLMSTDLIYFDGSRWMGGCCLARTEGFEGFGKCVVVNRKEQVERRTTGRQRKP